MQENAAFQLSQILDAGRLQLGYTDHQATGVDMPHIRTQRPAVASGLIDLASPLTRAIEAENVSTRYAGLTQHPAGKTTTVSSEIILRSLVAQAGARLVIVKEPAAQTKGDVTVFYRNAGQFHYAAGCLQLQDRLRRGLRPLFARDAAATGKPRAAGTTRCAMGR